MDVILKSEEVLSTILILCAVGSTGLRLKRVTPGARHLLPVQVDKGIPTAPSLLSLLASPAHGNLEFVLLSNCSIDIIRDTFCLVRGVTDCWGRYGRVVTAAGVFSGTEGTVSSVPVPNCH